MKKQTKKSAVKTATATPAPAAIDKTFVIETVKDILKSDWEVPDECVVGLFKHKVDQLEARINSLTSMLQAISAKLNAEPATPSGRVDAIEAAKGK